MSYPATMHALQQTSRKGPPDMRLITDAAITNWELVYQHQVHIIGLNIGVLIRAAPQIFGELMGELSALVAAGVLGPACPTIYDLAEGPKALVELEARTTVGKLALRP